MKVSKTKESSEEPVKTIYSA